MAGFRRWSWLSTRV